jgi:hypothetical protein
MEPFACWETRENSALVGNGPSRAASTARNSALVGKSATSHRLSSEEVRTGRKLVASPGDQTRRYRLVVTSVGITASTIPTTATPSMARAVCSQPIQAMNRMEFWAPRIIQK